MNNKKLIFILGSPRSGSTLLLSYLCGLKNTKILYETNICQTVYKEDTYTDGLYELAKYFDSIKEDIVVEKTPEHVHYLNIIEDLRKVCKRNIHVIYVTRPPVPTVLSILRAKEVLGVVDILGACEKYEESLVSIYHNLITKTHKSSKLKKYKCVPSYDSSGKVYMLNDYIDYLDTPYSFHLTYRGLTEDSYFTLHNLLVNELHFDLSDSDIRGLVVNRVNNLTKVLPQVVDEKHHTNLFKELNVVNKERFSNISSLVKEHKEEIKYITNYFSESSKKTNIYDLVTNKQVTEVSNNPWVTIIVPLYNKENYIKETLTSILNQTYTTYVCYIVDDGSTDSSREKVYEFLESLSKTIEPSKFILHTLPSNRGVSEARNVLIDWALSEEIEEDELITFCDADDIWDSTLVERSVDTFKKYPYVDCVYSRVLLLKNGELTKNHSKICSGDVYEDALEYNFLNCGSNIFVKASVIKEHNIRFNVKYIGCEDWDFLIQLAKIATFKCTKEYLVTYRQVPNSLSTNKELQVENGKKILERYLGVGTSQTYRGEKYHRIFTRLFLYYFSINNLKLEHIKDLDISYILRVVVSKLKAFVKSYLS